jgi:hypothetical protein
MLVFSCLLGVLGYLSRMVVFEFVTRARLEVGMCLLSSICVREPLALHLTDIGPCLSGLMGSLLWLDAMKHPVVISIT